MSTVTVAEFGELVKVFPKIVGLVIFVVVIFVVAILDTVVDVGNTTSTAARNALEAVAVSEKVRTKRSR